MTLHKYWFVVEYHLANSAPPPRRIAHGLGVTAPDAQTARDLLRDQVFAGKGVPKVLEVIEPVDPTTLDPDNILPNIGAPERFGVWYPALNVTKSDYGLAVRLLAPLLLETLVPLLARWKRMHPSVVAIQSLAKIRERRVRRIEEKIGIRSRKL